MLSCPPPLSPFPTPVSWGITAVVIHAACFFLSFSFFFKDWTWTVTFNPGVAADTAYYSMDGNPTVMSYESFYKR